MERYRLAARFRGYVFGLSGVEHFSVKIHTFVRIYAYIYIRAYPSMLALVGALWAFGGRAFCE